MIFYSGYTYKSLESLVEKLCSLVIKSETCKFQVRIFGFIQSVLLAALLLTLNVGYRCLQSVKHCSCVY